MILIKRTCSVLAVLLALAGCKKDVTPPEYDPQSPDAALAYVNGSEDLTLQIREGASFHYYGFILVDSRDTTYGRNEPPSPINAFPFFNREYQLQYPTTQFNTQQDQSWLRYKVIMPGAHELTLMDTAHNRVVTQKVLVEEGSRSTIFFSDNMGRYTSFALKDTLLRNEGHVGIRVIDFFFFLEISFTINNKKVNGFPDSMKFGDYSKQVFVPSAGTDTFRIKIYKKDDPSTVVTRTVLYTEPGHGYTVMLSGYTADQGYMSPVTKRFVNVSSNPRIKLFQNY